MRQIDNRTARTGSRQGQAERTARFTAFGLAAEAEPIASALYLVATPIGNLGDVTLRALKTLAAADAVLAEDTRVTKTLLAHYGITTPLVSDPGYRLVEAAIEAGLPVVPIPGASAALAALVVAGLPTDRFFFEGFLPAKAGPRRSRLEALAGMPGTLVLYEAPHRLAESLKDAAEVLGERPAAVARELTKMHETVRRGSLGELAARYAEEATPKGEIVLLIAPASAEARQAEAEIGLDDKLKAALARHTVKDAAALVAGETGLPRRDIYARALALARED